MGFLRTARFDRDVINRVTGVIVHLGLNDITIPSILPISTNPNSPQKPRERQWRHCRVAPLHTACTGAWDKDLRRHHRRTVEHRARRLHAEMKPSARPVNRSIRTSGAFDGVVDFDAAVR